MRTCLLVVMVGLLGCGKGDKAAGSGSGSATGSATVATGSAAGTGSAAEPTGGGATAATGSAAPAAASGTCEAACGRRKDCGVPGGDDVAKCTADCKSLPDVYTPEALASYSSAPCAEVAQGEPVYKATMACKAACAQRAKCVPEGKDEKQCLGDCTVVAIVAGETGLKDVETYATSECASVVEQEPAFQAISACVAGCKRALECGVEGTFPPCLTQCLGNISNKAFTVDQVIALAKETCEKVKENVRINPEPAQTADSGGGGGGGDCAALCRKLDSCQYVSFEGCMKDGCAGINPARIPQYVTASCQDIRSGNAIKSGQRCMRDGTQDCQTGMMCCRQFGNKYLGNVTGRATVAGEQGQCLYPVLCYR